MLSNSDSIALGSAIIAACALGLTFWQGFVQRRHAQLSVQPHFLFLRDSREESPSVVLINTGLGPGEIVYMRVTYESKIYDLNSDKDQSELRNALKSKAKDIRISIGGPGVGYLLSVGWRQPLVEFLNTKQSNEIHAAAHDFINKAQFNIEYKSIYGIVYR